MAFVDIAQAIEHLKESPRAAVQFVGGKGYGKTTHLLALSLYFPASHYLYLPEGERCAIPSNGDPILIDEAQRLTRLQRWTLFRSDRRLIFGTHVDDSAALRRAGRPVLTLAADRLTDAARVHKILNFRIQTFRRTAGPIPSITNATASELHTQFGSDLRSIEQSLYQLFQQLPDIRDV
jgi:hypothetical protein